MIDVMRDAAAERPFVKKLRRFAVAMPLVLMPFFLGGARDWFWTSIAALFCFTLVVLIWLDPRLMTSSRVSRKVALVAAVIVLFPFLQVLPLPVSLLQTLSPQRLPWLQKAQEVTGMSVEWAALSYVPLTTFFAGVWFLFLAIYAWFLHYMFQVERDLHWFFASLFIVAGGEAFYGILQVLIPSLGVLWEAEGQGIARGTFVNRNHYASLLNMLWPLLLSYTLGLGTGDYGLSGGRAEGRRLHGRTSAVEKDELGYAETERQRQVRQKQVFLGFIIGLVLFALFFSMSRGGILSALVALTVFVALGRFRSKKTLLFLAGCWTVLIVYGSIVGFGEIWARFDMVEDGALGRLIIWQDCWPIVKDHWLTGTGLGTFYDIFMVYQTHMSDTQKLSFAHNDYLHLMVELGLPMALFMFVLVWGYWWQRAWRIGRRAKGRRGEVPGSKIEVHSSKPKAEGKGLTSSAGGLSVSLREGREEASGVQRRPSAMEQEAGNARQHRAGSERSASTMGHSQGQMRSLLPVGALAGSAAFLCHCWVEFNWQIQADALYFVMLLVIMRDGKSLQA